MQDFYHQTNITIRLWYSPRFVSTLVLDFKLVESRVAPTFVGEWNVNIIRQKNQSLFFINYHTVVILSHSKHFYHSLYLTFPPWNLHESHHFLTKGASGHGLWTPDPECAEHAAAPWAPRTKRLPIQESWAWDACLVPWVKLCAGEKFSMYLHLVNQRVTWKLVKVWSDVVPCEMADS